MNKIYVVLGRTGLYEDRTEWPVQAYTSLTAAKNHIKLAQKRGDEIQKWAVENNHGWYDLSDNARPMNEYDRSMRIVDRYIAYTYYSAPLSPKNKIIRKNKKK